MTAATEPAAPSRPPRTIELAVIAAGVQILFTLIRAVGAWGSTAGWNKYLIYVNNHTSHSSKSYKNPYTASEIAKDLHTLRFGNTIQSLLICVLVGLAAYAFRRGRGVARWLYIVASVIVSVTGITALGAKSPQLYNLTSFVAALAAVAAIICLILPDSARFFAVNKRPRAGAPAPARGGGPAGVRAGGPARPGPATPSERRMGLRALFMPPPRPTPDAPAAGRPAANGGKRQPAATRPANAAAGKADAGKPAASGRSKAKVRTTEPAADAPAAADPSAPRGRGKSRRI